MKTNRRNAARVTADPKIAAQIHNESPGTKSIESGPPDTKSIDFDSVETALTQLKKGRPVIVLDDHDRENEGDLILSAELARTEDINFMARHARGLICIAMTGEALDRLGVPMMVPEKKETSKAINSGIGKTESDNAEGVKQDYGSPFTVSVEARVGVTTGISASDRARTVGVLADASSSADDIVMPGHIFPLRAHPKGVLARRGHTEAGVDLMRLANLAPAAVICEIMDEDGSMARTGSLRSFAAKHGIKIITIEDLVKYRMKLDLQSKVTRVDSARLPTKHGEFTVTAYRDENGQEHLVLSMGDDKLPDAPLVRLHSECLTGDVMGSLRCDCGDQLEAAFERIKQEGAGLVIYLRQEGRGIGLVNKIRAYALQDAGLDTVEANLDLGYGADQRDYSIAAALLNDRSITKIRLMTNNPAKIADLESNNIEIVERIPLEIIARPENEHYLRTKRDKLDHALV